MEIISKVLRTIKEIYDVIDDTAGNKRNCAKALVRVDGIQKIVQNCLKSNGETEQKLFIQQVIDENQRQALENLAQHMNQFLKLIKNHSNHSFFRRATFNKNFKSSYEDLDKHISNDIQIIQMGFDMKVIEQNKKILEQTKITLDLDDKMDETLGVLYKIEQRQNEAEKGYLKKDIEANNNDQANKTRQVTIMQQNDHILERLDELNNNMKMQEKKDCNKNNEKIKWLKEIFVGTFFFNNEVDGADAKSSWHCDDHTW